MSPVTTRPSTEAEIVEMLVPHLRSLGAESVSREVRSHGRSRTDIVMLTATEIVGIEVKNGDWRRAIAQAALNRYCFDRSYVALWVGHVRDAVLSEAKKWGIGVIAVDPDDLAVLRRAPRGRPVRTLRNDLLQRLRGEPT